MNKSLEAVAPSGQFVGVHDRGLSVVATLSRAFGVLPTADGGRAVWALLNAARPNSSASNGMSNPRPAPDTQPGPAAPLSRRGLSTYSRTLATTGVGFSQKQTVPSDQR